MVDQVTYSGTLSGSDGSALQVQSLVYVPPSTPLPGPVPPPAPQPVPTPSRDRVRLLWHHGWSGPSIDSWPVDIASSVTAVGLVMSQSKKAGTGQLTDPPGVTKAQITRLRSDGIDVLVGIGGSSDGGIDITTSATVAQALASLQSMRDRLGVNGTIIDLEGAPGSGWSAAAMSDLGQALVGAGMKVSIWSALYGGRFEGWGAVAQALGDGLHSWQRGFYDFPQANDGQLSGIVTGDLPRMRRYLTRDDQLVASFAPVGATSRTPAPVMKAAYSAGRKVARPGTNVPMTDVGWSVWEDYQDSRAGWTSTRALATA